MLYGNQNTHYGSVLDTGESNMLDHLTTTNDREIFFKVYEQDVVGEATGCEAYKHKMLTRGNGISEEDSFLSIVKSNYRIVENEEILMPLQEQMINYFDPTVLADVQIKDHIAKDGAVCFSEYIFPSVKKPVETDTGHKTNMMLRFILKNTFNGSSSVVFYGGLIDAFCTNGMILGDYDVTKRKHTKNFTIDGFIEAFDDCMVNYKNVADTYQKWANTKISYRHNIPLLFSKLTNNQDPKKKNTLADRLYAQCMDEVTNRGNNLFAVTSAMTHYASHNDNRFPLRSNADNDSLFKRQETVRKWFNSKTFEDFLEAA